ncbi:DUF4430 domain-containing protein [Anaerobacillus sp. CMMVII]|uniref:DUF4430 domain-containing protein n=1 Tax=Anaerobacillus sp. CMMVII TaxID=2755588 RepID=UPI0021B71ECD|nr:DUF4430 domain-containing protein [Anaerobacillus sp. CMMVII]MCT8138836.1 DUF4430 domain-containing protein [Anaerobacillus sp. CMMVII]
MRKLLFLVTIFFALLTVGCSNEVKQESSTSAANAQIILVVDEESEVFEVEFVEGLSLMEIMKENFDVETAFEDSFIIGINGLLADDSAKMGWMYTINGEFAMKGANEYTPEDGDTVEFKYESWE